MFQINDRKIKRLEESLETMAKKAIPFATRKTLNDGAFQTQKVARADVKKSMVTRNQFTVRSIQVEQSRTLNVKLQSATVGSIADYMETQEFGGTKGKQGKKGVPIATSYSAGQSQNDRPRKRLPRKPNKLANIQLQRRRKRGSSRKQQNIAAIKGAAESGRKFIYLELGNRRRGIFRVLGGKRKPRIKMVHDLTRTSVNIPANPWLKPATDEVARMLPAFYADALRFQLRRRGVFK